MENPILQALTNLEQLAKLRLDRIRELEEQIVFLKTEVYKYSYVPNTNWWLRDEAIRQMEEYLVDLANLSKLVRAGDGTATAQALIAIAERLERLVELGEKQQGRETTLGTV